MKRLFHVIFTTSTQRTVEMDVEAWDAETAATAAKSSYFADEHGRHARGVITHLLVRLVRDDHL